MQKLKVLQIIPSFGIGGAEKLVLDYLTYFDRDRVEIKAISMNSNQNTLYDNFIHENGLDVVYLDKKPGLDLSTVFQINKFIKSYKPDIIHSHMNSMKYILYSVINNKQIKLFHTIHNEPEKDAVHVDKFFNKLAFKYFNCTPIALTSELGEKVKSYYQLNNVEVINNGINLKSFKNITDSKKLIREKLNLPQDSFIIGHVGRFSKQKNHEFIIDIYNRIAKLKQDSYLVLVGDGELRKEMEQKVKLIGLENNVKFLGLRKDIPMLIKAMDVFLFPSIHEGFPITLLEAQATGVRCVISDQIDKKAILSEQTVSVGLEDSIDRWCSVILDENMKSNPTINICEYDINNVVKILEERYKFHKYISI